MEDVLATDLDKDTSDEDRVDDDTLSQRIRISHVFVGNGRRPVSSARDEVQVSLRKNVVCSMWR
jgi:hypothetical protein